MPKPKIYTFVNASNRMGLVVTAIAEDGHVLAGHFSSNEDFAKHDIGFTSEQKHNLYKEHYPDGYEVVWLDDPLTQIPTEVMERNMALKEEAI